MSGVLRQQIHLNSFYGEIIAPTGLYSPGDVFHIFYECLPGNGKMQWGHFSTKDFAVYKEHRPFLLPDTRFDSDGVFGGNAVTDNERTVFFFAGREAVSTDAKEEKNILSATLSKDGRPEKTFLFKPQTVSSEVSVPFVYKSNSGFKMLIGTRTESGEGGAMVYTSKDLAKWKYSHLITGHTPLGDMWEYPSVFKTEKGRCLVFCPRNSMNSEESPPHTAAWGMVCDNIVKDCLCLDYGFDFYAPHIFKDSSGEIVMFGKLSVPDCPYEASSPLPSCLSVPRKLFFEGDMLCQEPLEILKDLRCEKRFLNMQSGETADTFGAVFEAELEFSDESFAFLIREDVKIECNEGNFSVSLGKSGLGRTTKAFRCDNYRNIHIFSDRGSLEIFVGGKVFSTRLCDNQKGTVSILYGNCRAMIYKLNSITFQ